MQTHPVTELISRLTSLDASQSLLLLQTVLFAAIMLLFASICISIKKSTAGVENPSEQVAAIPFVSVFLEACAMIGLAQVLLYISS